MSKIGLMLSGGGAKGAYQLGVLKALNEMKLLEQIDVISGTSIGAINTCLLMTNDFNELIDVWNIIDSKQIFSNSTHKTEKNRLYSLSDLYQTLKTRIGNDKVINSRYKGYVTLSRLVETNISLLGQMNKSNLEKEVILLNEVSNPFEYVLGSASMPILFGPTLINENSYIDGGMVDNNPIGPLLEEGCDIIIAISLDNKIDYESYASKNLIILDFSDYKSTYHSPLKGLLASLQFSSEAKNEKEALGYNTAKELLIKLSLEKVIINTNGEYKIVRNNKLFCHYK